MSNFRSDPLTDDHGFQPNVWGPPLWFFLHTASLNFPAKPTPEQKMQYFTFFKSVGFVLPCRYCRESYQKWTETLSMREFESRETLSRWLYDIHNKVNKKLNKGPDYTPSYDQVLRYYNQFRGGIDDCPKFRSRLHIKRNM